jgi:ectoine hydroxylase-related dioxygenase (phytanoyl-CoA dioxygenase family)
LEYSPPGCGFKTGGGKVRPALLREKKKGTLMNREPAQFAELGYCIFDNVLSDDDIQQCRGELTQLIASMPAEVEVFSNEGTVTRASRPEYLTEPHAKHPYWLELCTHPAVLDRVEDVIGPDITLIMSHLIVKPPRDGLAVKWHQDNTYWPSVQGTDVVTVWLAIDDVDEGNGCMKVIPCTHQEYEEMEKVPTDGNDLLGIATPVSKDLAAQAVPVELSAGSLSVHDSYILHGSEANTSARRRAGYTMRYANTRTTQVDVKNHWSPVYLCRGIATKATAEYIDLRPV